VVTRTLLILLTANNCRKCNKYLIVLVFTAVQFAFRVVKPNGLNNVFCFSFLYLSLGFYLCVYLSVCLLIS
jgi:hypothetical protein